MAFDIVCDSLMIHSERDLNPGITRVPLCPRVLADFCSGLSLLNDLGEGGQQMQVNLLLHEALF